MVLITSGSHEVFESHRVASQIGVVETHITLALVGCVVYRDQQPLLTGVLPGKCQERIRCPVAFPCRQAFEQVPLAVSNRPLPEHREEAIVEPVERFVGGLLRRADQMR